MRKTIISGIVTLLIFVSVLPINASAQNSTMTAEQISRSVSSAAESIEAPTLAIATSAGKPKLSWNAVDGAVKYWVYRSTDNVSFTVYTTVTGTSYINSGAANNARYYYKVKAVKVVDGVNVASAFSNTVSVTTALAAPVVSITTVNGKPCISWDTVDGAAGYYIFRSVDGKSYGYLGYTTGTRYINSSAEPGVTYYYRVKADNSGADTQTDAAPGKTAEKLVEQARAWLGCKESDGSNKEIIDIYNAHEPVARGIRLGYTDAWCAAFVSACSIKTDMTDIVPTECGCGSMVKLFQRLGEWDEADDRIPNVGDIIFFDWDDTGEGDNTAFPGHVGIVEKVNGADITVIDGNNQNDAVERRTVQINGRYIRGYGVPKYDGPASSDTRSAYSNAVSALCFPSAPALSITTSAGHPRITWNAVDGVTKYWIYRSLDGENFRLYDTVTGTSYTNISTTIGTTYYYKVQAVKVVNGKDFVSEDSAVRSTRCNPAAPSLSISRVNGKAKLSWKAVDGAVKYWVYRSTDNVNFSVYMTVTGTSYTNSGAASGTHYYYKVKAVKVINGVNIASAFSSTRDIITTLSKPTVSITTLNGKPRLTWEAVTGADKYYIYRSLDGRSFSYYDTIASASYTNISAKKNTTYYYKIKAVCTSDSSASSAQSTAVSVKATK